MAISSLAVDETLLQTLVGQMVETSAALAAEADPGARLRIIVRRAREVTGARYAALSIFDDAGRVSRFVFEGFDERTAQTLGHPPVGRGLLGRLAIHQGPMRLDDLRTHEWFTGWPEGHPLMGAFLGMPLHAADRVIGSLYLTRGDGEPPFTALEELSLSILALQASSVVAVALTQERQQRVALLEERQRIAHDLHDGTIQALYALGLEIRMRLDRTDMPEDVYEEMAAEVALIDTLIREIREYITALEQVLPSRNPELSQDLAHVVRMMVPENIDTVLNISAGPLQELSSREAEDLLYIAREAISNAVRHGSPTRVAVDLREAQNEIALTIQDNGVGFNQAAARVGLGTVTMRTRAERLGGQLTTMSIPGMGTTVRVTRPRPLPQREEDTHVDEPLDTGASS